MLRGREKSLVLVKALPHDSKIGETVCCAGVTPEGEWRRQYPIRFRHLRDKKFVRWQWIEYEWTAPKDDQRVESRRVLEDTIQPGPLMPKAERARFLAPLVVGSVAEAAASGKSLALIRPCEVSLTCRKKSREDLEKERKSFAEAAQQRSFFDEDLTALEPCPYEFHFRYKTEDGKTHGNNCADWETAATYWRLEKDYGEAEAIKKMQATFADEYPRKGMAFAMGTHSRYPSTWLLIGVLRLDPCRQLALF